MAVSGFNKKLEVSEELQAVIGKNHIPRSQVVKLLWAYIKKHKLQDEEQRRIINPDETLGAVLGNAPIDMFKMQKKLANHLS